jgi:hypothetical protein
VYLDLRNAFGWYDLTITVDTDALSHAAWADMWKQDVAA